MISEGIAPSLWILGRGSGPAGASARSPAASGPSGACRWQETAPDPAAVRAHLAGSREAAFYQNKVQAAIHFAHRGLPLVAAHAVGLLAGETAPMEAVF